MTEPVSNLFLDLHLRYQDPLLFLPLGIIFVLLLGYLCYTDLFKGKYVPDVASLGLLFVAWATIPLLYSDPKRMIFWALGASLFFFVIFMIGAVADGDLKIYLAYAALLGPAAFVAAFLSWVLIIGYSIPLMIRSRKEGGQKKGERLGVAPGVPGIALALPLTLALLGVPIVWPLLMILGMAGVVAACLLGTRLNASKKQV